ncbi:MAG: MarC family protein [Zetaproteobacteria bacterium]|nr:MAG: MarC family protein [Zetaproteobacteria bacterium]
MTLAEMVGLALLVLDPFGNLPFVLAVFARLSAGDYRRAVLREGMLAWLVLAGFAWGGEAILGWFAIEPAALHVAGGIVLFLIALEMIFGSAARLFSGPVDQGDPVLFPVAVPAIAGPSAAALMMFFAHQAGALKASLAAALAVAGTIAVLLAGRLLSNALGQRGLLALEKLSGIVLSVVAVQMTLAGLKAYFQ